MPLGTQEGQSPAHALEALKARGRGVSIDLRDLALELQAVVDEYNSAAVRDLVAVIATRLYPRVEEAEAGGSEQPQG
ncbi:MAG TPA: hypothetical protein VG452_12420 [Egibacteraceae bacterium]|nr:hypothetical protein [Egibacteraceae bacterium]